MHRSICCAYLRMHMHPHPSIIPFDVPRYVGEGGKKHGRRGGFPGSLQREMLSVDL